MGYKFIAEMGEGSFSQVKLATPRKHHCNVAIKIVDRVKSPKDFVQKFLPRELVILRRVNHDHIVQMYELIEVAGKCIVMEAAAKDLLQKIHEVNRIPEDQSKNLFSQMVSAINYLHQMDIVHRPKNNRTFCGSAAYTPPEVIMGMPYDPKKYDIWSLGVILYVMVTGSMPYDETNLRRLNRLQRKSLVYPDDAGVQEPSRVFIRTLLQYNSSTRPTIQQVAEHPWLQMGKSLKHKNATQRTAASQGEMEWC
uniref:non-specific serine/threonine protein kinase n=1 Tax=Cyprinus carpio carpio TaxID=630221 RepID=A0A8C1ES32_CYPCA